MKVRNIILLLPLLAVIFSGCSKEEDERNFGEKLLLDYHGKTTASKVYRGIVMRSDANIPFHCAVVRTPQHDFYVKELAVKGELKSSGIIYNYQTYKAAPNEAYSIELPATSRSVALNEPCSTRGLIISAEKYGIVRDVFRMKVRYSTMVIIGFPAIMLFDSCFFELEDGSLIYAKDYKTAGEEFSIGDHIAYKTYTLFPNEIVSIKKVNNN